MRLALFPVAILALGCTAATAAVPGVAELREALAGNCIGRAPEVRNVRCEGFEEEPTEFSCHFEQRGPGGSWIGAETVIAVDGPHWLTIDGYSRCRT